MDQISGSRKIGDLTLSNPIKEEESQQQQPKDDYLFFNVMPKVKVEDKLVEPTMKVVEPTNTADHSSGGPSFMKRFRLYIVLGVAALIAIPAVYFGVTKIFGDPYEGEESIFNPEASSNTTKPAEEEKEEEKPAYTTSKEWQAKYFNAETCQNLGVCGDEADPDRDGLTNVQEFKIETDPNNPDSDQDKIADGDEVNVFMSDPLKTHTAGNPQYSDADFLVGGYDIQNPDKQYTEERINEINERMQEFGLHQPTIARLENALPKIYKFGELKQEAPKKEETASSTPSTEIEGVDNSLEAKQDRDVQRSNTIKTIGIALVKYKNDNKIYPKTTDFKETYESVKAYIRTATNPSDPIDKAPYVYTYMPNELGDDFTMTFYSEVANQVIKKRAADAQKDMMSEEAKNYDDQRKNSLELLQSALLLYSNKNVAGSQDYVFPSPDKYKTELVPNYISTIPKDPKTEADYEYKVSEEFDTFTLKAIFDNPKPGTTGYLCNQEECREY